MSSTGYNVQIDTIMDLAKRNYDIAERYAGVFRKIADTDGARLNLADDSGQPGPADTEILSILDEFSEYLRTTAARYQITGEQLERAAGTYVQTDHDQYDVWRRYHEEFQQDHVGDYFDDGQPASPRDDDLTIDPDKDADDTDRPDGANDDEAPGFGTDEHPDTDDDDHLGGLGDVGDDRRKEIAR